MSTSCATASAPAATAAYHPDDINDPSHPYNQKPTPGVWPGAGWRWVQVGEALAAGDETFFKNSGSGLHPLAALTEDDLSGLDGNVAANSLFPSARDWRGDESCPAWPFGYYRRKIDPTAPAKPGISPGPGYRFLAPGETARSGVDQFINSDGRVVRCNVNPTLTPENVGTWQKHIIRRLPRKPPGTPPPGYRFVEEFEVLKDTDRYRWNGTFFPVLSVGERLGDCVGHDGFFQHDSHYVRPLPEPEPAQPAPKPEAPAPAQPSKRYPNGTPPAGYRFLAWGEVIEEGDEYADRRFGNAPRRLSDCFVGRTAGSLNDFESLPAIRRIPAPIAPAKPAPRVPSGTPPAGYRFLHEGEVVQEGDQYVSSYDSRILHDAKSFIGESVGRYNADLTSEPYVRRIETPKPAPRGDIPHGYRELAPGETIRRTDLYQHAHDKTWRLRAGTVRCGSAYTPASPALGKQRPPPRTIRRDWSIDPTSFPRFKSPKGIVYHDNPGTALKFVPDVLKEDFSRHVEAGEKVIGIIQVSDDNPVDLEIVNIPQPEAVAFSQALNGFSYHDFAAKGGAS